MPSQRSLLSSIFRMRCPRCRRGPLFTDPNPFNLRKIEVMHKQCPVCGQDLVVEPGFYFGSTYISYALNVAWIIPGFLIAYAVLGWSFQAIMIGMLSVLLVLAPVLFRLSRSIWVHIFVRYQRGEG
jgi:hypothetical protein